LSVAASYAKAKTSAQTLSKERSWWYALTQLQHPTKRSSHKKN